MKKYVMVIGEITATTFRRYAAQTHVGPREFPTLNESYIWDPSIQNYKPNPNFVDPVPAGVLISSPGGDIGYMLAMLDDIDYWKRETLATGICQSAAAVLATAGEGKRICTMDTLFRFKPAEPELMDDPDNPGQKIERVPDIRHYLQHLLISRVAQRLNTPLADAELLFDGKFITSIRAQELGLVDEVISTENTPYGNPSGLSGSEREIAESEGEFGSIRGVSL